MDTDLMKYDINFRKLANYLAPRYRVDKEDLYAQAWVIYLELLETQKKIRALKEQGNTNEEIEEKTQKSQEFIEKRLNEEYSRAYILRAIKNNLRTYAKRYLRGHPDLSYADTGYMESFTVSQKGPSETEFKDTVRKMGLDKEELKILNLKAKGYKNKEIAGQLNMYSQVVSTKLEKIREKWEEAYNA